MRRGLEEGERGLGPDRKGRERELEELLARAPDYEVIEDETIRLKTEFVQGYSHFPIAFGPLRSP